ncbi:hypothetical protein CsSME_00011983 [Camellia sinensis var. sinensis]
MAVAPFDHVNNTVIITAATTITLNLGYNILGDFKNLEPCLLSHIRIYNKSVLEWEIAVGLRYKPETFVKVRPRCEAPRRDMTYPMNYTPCRYVRISCLRGNPIAVFFIQGAACVRRPVLCGTYSNFVMSPLSWLRVVETPFEVVVEALKLNVGKALGLDGMMITFS